VVLGSRSRATTGGGGPKVDRARRLKELERENRRLKKAVSDLTRDKLILKEALEGKY
jgi:putative transposase